MRLGVESALVRGEFVRGDVEVRDGLVAAVGLAPPGVRGRIAVPGFVDLQVNGAGGVDFLATAADYAQAGAALLATGVTAYQPTLVTAPEAALVAALRALPAEGGPGPRVLGAHLEGPFLAPERPGAHPPEHLRAPDLALLERLLDAGRVTQMTLAPELSGAAGLIARLRARGVVVSAGHTNATAAEAHTAFDLGVSAVTHVFNAMRPLGSRDPGVVGASLTRPGIVVTAIVDGRHLADETVRLVWRCAAGRLALVSDAVAVSGTGAFRLGARELEALEGHVPALADGTLAGSTLTMIDAVRNLHGLGIPFADAVGAATTVPARLLGRVGIGVLEPGGPADAVVLDDRLEIVAVMRAGVAAVAARG